MIDYEGEKENNKDPDIIKIYNIYITIMHKDRI